MVDTVKSLPAVFTRAPLENSGPLVSMSSPHSPQRQHQMMAGQLLQVQEQMLLAACQPPHVLAALYSNALQQQQQTLQQEQHGHALLQHCFAAHSAGAALPSNGSMQHLQQAAMSGLSMPSGAYGAPAGVPPTGQPGHPWLLQQAAAAAAALQSGNMGSAAAAAAAAAAAQQYQLSNASLAFGLDPHAMAGAGIGGSQEPRQRRHSHLGFAQPVENRRRRFSVDLPAVAPSPMGAAATGASALAGMYGLGVPYEGLGAGRPPASAGAYAARARRSSWCPPSSHHSDLATGFTDGTFMPTAAMSEAGLLHQPGMQPGMQPQSQELQELLSQRLMSASPAGLAYSISQPGSPCRAACEPGLGQALPALQYGLSLGGSPTGAAAIRQQHQHHGHHQQHRLASSTSLGGATAAELQLALQALSGVTLATDSPVKHNHHQQQQRQRGGAVAAFWQRTSGALLGSAASSLAGTPTACHGSTFEQLLDQQLPGPAELAGEAAAVAAAKAAALQDHWEPSSPTRRTSLGAAAIGAIGSGSFGAADHAGNAWDVEAAAVAVRAEGDQRVRRAKLVALLDAKHTLAAVAEQQPAGADVGAAGDAAEAGACRCQGHDCARNDANAGQLATEREAEAGSRGRRSSSSGGSASNDGSSKLFVGNIGWWVTEEDLLYWFGKFGAVTNVKIMYNSRKMHKPKDKWRSREYGFVDYGSREEASRAIAWMDGVELAELMKDSSGIIVQYAKPTME